MELKQHGDMFAVNSWLEGCCSRMINPESEMTGRTYRVDHWLHHVAAYPLRGLYRTENIPSMRNAGIFLTHLLLMWCLRSIR